MSLNKKWLWLSAVALACAAPNQAFSQVPRALKLSELPTSYYRGEAAPISYAEENDFLSEDADPAAAAPAPAAVAPRPQTGSTSIYDTTPCAPDCCMDCSAGPTCSVIALAESTFFWPQVSGVGTFNGIGAGGLGGPISQIGGGNPNYYLVAPRLTLGIQGCRWGLVGRYWDAQAWTTGFAPSNPLLSQPGLNSSNNFRAYTADIELQRRFVGRRWNLWGFGGFRYGALKNQQFLSATSFTGSDIVTSSAFAASRFNGAGFTFGAYGTHAIGDSPFSLFASNRYSFLFGSGTAAAETHAQVLNGAGVGTGINGAFADGDGSMFIAEVQLGLQWEHQLRWMPGRAFIRTAAEYQYWNSNCVAGAASTTTSFFNNNVATSSASAADMMLNMVGFNVGCGIIY